MRGVQRLWIDGEQTTRQCVDCDELKHAEFWLVPASRYGMGHGRVTVCDGCFDGDESEGDA